MFWPCETRTSTCRSFATISSGLYRFLAIAVLLDVKDIPQVGPLQWGWIILLCGGLWRESSQIVESFGSVYAVPRISSGIHEDPTQHIRSSNNAQLRELSFGRARAYPARSLQLNRLDKCVIIESGPSRFIKEMVFRADLFFSQHSLREPRHVFHEALIFPKLDKLEGSSWRTSQVSSDCEVLSRHASRCYTLATATQEALIVPNTIFERLAKGRPTPPTEKPKRQPKEQAEALLRWLERWPKPVVSSRDIRIWGPLALHNKENAI